MALVVYHQQAPLLFCYTILFILKLLKVSSKLIGHQNMRDTLLLLLLLLLLIYWRHL
jgi:hypothetical protein